MKQTMKIDLSSRLDAAGWPIARATDPQTSHAAAERHTLSKRAERQRQVLDLVCRFPNRTSGELSRLMAKLYSHLPIRTAVESPHKRLSDLEDKGLVEKGASRKCTDSGYEAVTWHATAAGVVENERADI